MKTVSVFPVFCFSHHYPQRFYMCCYIPSRAQLLNCITISSLWIQTYFWSLLLSTWKVTSALDGEERRPEIHLHSQATQPGYIQGHTNRINLLMQHNKKSTNGSPCLVEWNFRNKYNITRTIILIFKAILKTKLESKAENKFRWNLLMPLF